MGQRHLGIETCAVDACELPNHDAQRAARHAIAVQSDVLQGCMLQCFSSAENLRHHIMHNASMVSVVSVPQVGGVINTRYEHMFFIYNTTNKNFRGPSAAAGG